MSDTPLLSTIIIFLSITVIGPIFEEIMFRHIIIRELGNIFSYKFMAIASIISFSYIHIISSKNMYEIIVYLILSLPLVYFYFKSNFNIFIPIYFHIMVNLTSYIYIVIYN
ncbi:CPBP family intramembrane glutamic endopeptidase [Staphylococcus agnetis]|uniref:CPBP family intramembrane glutamic endopeptidase n=1 Tax=Staphylococcus agnetis TaxID=985762 RepID=UPI001CB8D3EF